jgi:hypothetical protein
MEIDYYLIHNYDDCPGMILSILPETQVRLHNRWAKYTYMPKKIGDTVTFHMYNYSTDFRGVIIFAGTKQECLFRLSTFPKVKISDLHQYDIPIVDVDFETNETIEDENLDLFKN